MKQFIRILSAALVLALVLGATQAMALTGGTPPAQAPARATEQPPVQTEAPVQATEQPPVQTEAPAQSSGITITGVTRDGYGDVSVTWDGGTAPYRLAYYAVDGADSTLWNAVTGITGKSGVINELLPNFGYVVAVVDANGEYDSYTLEPNDKKFTALGKMRLTMTLRQTVKKSASTVKQFSAANILQSVQGSGNQYGATIKLADYRSKEPLLFTFRMGVTLPDGEPIIFYVNRMTLPKGSADSFAYWNFFDFVDLWNNIMVAKGEIPTGTYTYYICLDDSLVASSSFTVVD